MLNNMKGIYDELVNEYQKYQAFDVRTESPPVVCEETIENYFLLDDSASDVQD